MSSNLQVFVIFILPFEFKYVKEKNINIVVSNYNINIVVTY